VADDQWYRDMKKVKPYWQLDPIKRMRAYLLEHGIADEDTLSGLEKKAVDAVSDAIKYASEECTDPPEDALYDGLYANNEVIK